MSRPPLALGVLLALAALGSIAWGLVVPALQGPDESSHLGAVSRIADRGALLPAAGERGLPRELLVTAAEAGFGPLIGNVGARPFWTPLDERRLRAAERRLGDERAALVAEPAAAPPVQGSNRNPPLYYAYLALPWRVAGGSSFIDRVHLARLFNVPLLLATVALTWLIAGALLPGTPWARPLAAGFVALQPQLSFLSGTVNPDVLLVTLFTAFVALAVWTLRTGPSRARVAGLAITALAASATHPRGVLLFPVAAVVLLLCTELPRRARRALLALAVVLGAVALVVGGAYVEWTSADGISAPFDVRQFGSYVWQFYLPRLSFMDPAIGGDYGAADVWVRTHLGTFGSLEVQFPGWVYDVLGGAAIVVLVGVGAASIRHRAAVRERWRTAVALLVLAGLTVAALHLVAYRTLLIAPDDPIIVGRHLLPLVSLVAVAVAVAGLALPRRLGRGYAAVVLAGLVGLQLGGLGVTLARFYG